MTETMSEQKAVPILASQEALVKGLVELVEKHRRGEITQKECKQAILDLRSSLFFQQNI